MVGRKTYDSVIIGGGLAGLRAALELAGKCKVAIVSKSHPLRSNSVAAQGGVNAAMSPDDSWQKHMEDTVKAGAFLNDQDAVEVLVRGAKDAIVELDNLGALFSRTKGKIAQRKFGAQSVPRACYAADKTGQTLLHTLFEQVSKKGVEILDDYVLLDVIVEKNYCKGVLCLDVRNGQVVALNAKSVLIATGGYARLYQVSSNNHCNTADAQGILYRRGLPMKDMEFVQFHPTGLFPSGILISETARGEGGVLVNDRGERFMQRYDPRMELATRDAISKAVQQEIVSGRGIKQNNYVYLDLTKIDSKVIDERLPQIKRLAKDFAGVDVTDQPISVRPTAHYSMGGIATDKKAQVLTRDGEIFGLYAAGECACLSVHGANRLGGNSLLETLVFGKIAGKEMTTYNFKVRTGMIGEQSLKEAVVMVDRIKKKNGNEKLFTIRVELAQLMEKKVGVFRDQKGLYEAKDVIKKLRERLDHVGLTDKGNIFNTELVEALELRNMIDVSEAIVHTAMARKETRGAHSRSDYPSKSNEYLKHSFIYRLGGQVVVEHDDVVMTKLKPER
ncbi:FAD-dependent oxidoreductase [Nanoarchaeota archaeon]